MKTRSLRIIMRIFTAAIFIGVFFQNCSPVTFKPGEQSSAVGTHCNVGQTTDCAPLFMEMFSVSATNAVRPMDMIWVVDNSGSMAEEASNVRSNLTNFINALDKSSDMKFLLISKEGNSGFSVSLPSGLDSSRFMQKNIEIDSTHGPAVLLNELSSDIGLGDIGMGTPFFRPDSKKIIVFVTDDNSAMSAAIFTKSLSDLGVNKGDVSIFGFVGLGEAVSDCQAFTGDVYKDLASQSGGNTYNICDSDWSLNFSTLKTDVLTKLGRSYIIKDPLAALVTSVEVDGVVIPTSMYSFANGVLTINDKVVMTEQSSIKVFYTTK